MSSNNSNSPTPSSPIILFTPERREQVYHNLITFLKTDEQIQGVVMVGSGVDGFRDHYSGIDLIVVVKESRLVSEAASKWRTRLETLYQTVCRHETSIGLDYKHYSVMLDSYLTIDMQFLTEARLRQEIAPYKIIFDRTGEIEVLMKRAPNQPIHHNPQAKYAEIIQAVWQPMLKGVIAVKRSETWRAVYMLELVRDYTVKLAGIRYGLDVRSFHDADLLPEMFLVHLRHTLPTSISDVAIKRSITTAITLFFGEAAALDERFNVDLSSHLEAHIMNFIEAYG